MAIPIEKVAEIKRLWEAGQTRAQIAKAVDVSAATVQSYLDSKGTQADYRREKLAQQARKADDVPFVSQEEADAGIARLTERKSVEAASDVLKDSVELAAKVWHDALAGTEDINATRFNTAKAILKKHGLLAEDEQIVTKSVYDTMTNATLARKVEEAARAIGIALVERSSEADSEDITPGNSHGQH